MICPRCGNQMNDSASFCSNCGLAKDGDVKKKFIENLKNSKYFTIVIVVVVVLLLFLFIVPNVINVFSSGKIVADDSGNEYYIDRDGNRHYNEWIVYKGDDYYTDGAGYIDKDKWAGDYYLSASGKMLKSDWVSDGGMYYYVKSNGAYAKNEVLKIDKDYYAFADDGVLFLGNFFYNPQNPEKISYADSEGRMIIKDWFKNPETDMYHYFDSDGYMFMNCIEKIDNKYYAFDELGVLIVYRLFNDMYNKGKFLFADENGEVVKKEGFIVYLSATYFLDKDGYVVMGQWILFDNDYYYLLSNGILARSMWIERTYYVDHDGKMLYSTKTPDGYDVDADGKIIGRLKSVKSTRYSIKFISSDVSEFPRVKLYYKIYDSNGNVKSDFNVYEVKVNERNNTGAYIPRVVNVGEIIAKKQGLSVSLIADRSTSLNSNDLAKIKSSMKTFISSMDFAIGDKSEVISFGSDIVNVCSFTNNSQSLYNGIDTISLSGSTALYDAIYRGISHAAGQNGAKCVVVFTDGQDNMSRNSKQTVINYSLQQQVPIYVVGVGNSIATYDLQSIANSTGGRYWGINSVGELTRVYQDVYNEGKSTYYIEYVTDNSSASQYGLRDVQVTIDDGVEYVELANSFTPSNPNTIVGDNYSASSSSSSSSSSGSNNSNTSNSSNNSSASSGSSGSSGSSSIGGLTLAYGSTINEKYDYDETNQVTIKIRRPKIEGGSLEEMNNVNSNIGHAMDELVVWCQDYIDDSDICPKTININQSTLESANSSEIRIKMNGTITFKGTNNTENILFRFTYDIDADNYTFSPL